MTPALLPADQQVAPDLVRVLEGLVDDATRPGADREVARRLEWLIESLVLRGHLSPAHRSLLHRIRGDASVVRLSVVPDKRAVPSKDRDCASLFHLCKGRCCAMEVSLSEEDLAGGRLRWDLQRPYVLRRDTSHGYCANLDQAGRCAVYEDRPAMCRSYDCANDPRVWEDWERKLPAPLPWLLVPPDEREATAAADQAEGAGPTTSAG